MKQRSFSCWKKRLKLLFVFCYLLLLFVVAAVVGDGDAYAHGGE